MKRWFAGLLGLCVTFSWAVPSHAAAAGPDILVIMPDQMRGDGMSAVGHPVVHTPNLDALAAEGTLFRRAYSSVPSCIPARVAFLTGQQPQTSGVVGYGQRTITEPTLPAVLAQAGYTTVLIGRNMHQSPASGDLGYQQQDPPKEDPVAGDIALKARHPESGGVKGILETLGIDSNRWPAAPWPYEEELHPTSWIMARSRQVVAETPADQPLFLTASFYAPHPPLFPPVRLFEKHLASELPPVAMGDWVDQSALSPEGSQPHGERVLLQGELLRRAQAGYFGLIEQLDEQVGGLIEDFRARSEKAGREWVVLFTSDHGEMLGDHGYFRKCEPYEGSANIPLIVTASEGLGLRRGARTMEPAGLEDLMPTLLELAGVEQPATVDGLSLVPVLRGSEAPLREMLHYEHSPLYRPEQGFHALVDRQYKYIWRPSNGEEQLFDLTADILEEHNLAVAPGQAETLALWRGRMIQRLSGRPEGFTDGQTLLAGRPYKRLYEPRTRTNP